jgi:hypothetical protein
MTWAPLLLADPSPCLRLLVLRELMGRDEDDPEARELAELRDSDRIVRGLLRAQDENGSWRPGPMNLIGGRQRATSLALSRLGYVGFGPEHPAVERGAEFLFGLQRKDGAWPLRGGGAQQDEEYEGYTMVPLQTALPLQALAACGYATDDRAERAYEWLLSNRLDDGAWPTGMAGGNFGYAAGYRRLSHSRWGCRSNTTGALTCLALHPDRRRNQAARRALELLLGRETHEAQTLGFEVARMIGAEPPRGFFTWYARFDLAQVLDLCWRIGASREDARVDEIVLAVEGMCGPRGLWDYPAHPQVSRWLTFDLLRSLSRLAEAGEWFSLEPRTPFQAYPRRPKRY